MLDYPIQKIHIFHLCHMKGHETSITLHPKTWHHPCLVFMLSALKKGHRKNLFSHYKICVKIICAITLERFHIVPQSYAASFSIKTCIYETNILLFKELNKFTQND